MSDDAFCGQCGQRIPATAKFCKFCGAAQVPIDVAPAPASAAPPPASPSPPPPAPPPPAAAPQPSGPPDGGLSAQSAPQTPQPAPRSSAHAPPPPLPPPDQPTAAPRDQAAAFARQAADRMESAAPGAGELAGQLAAQLSTPAVAAAGLAAAFTTGLMLTVGLLLALLPAESSLFLLDEGSVVNQTLVNTATFTSAPLRAGDGAIEASVQTMPMLFVLLPLGGMAYFMAAQRSRLALLTPGRRLIAGTAGAIPLALLLLIVSIAGKVDEVRPDVGAVVLLALLWGAVGGALGAWWTLRDEAPDVVGTFAPPAMQAPLRACGAVVRPLLVALALCAVIGTAIVTIQTLRDAGEVRVSRSGLGATIENALYAPEHGIHVFELGSFVEFKTTLPSSLQLPIPVDSPGHLLEADVSGEAGDLTFRIFDYSEAVPSWLFILALLGFIAIPVLFAVYAGFAAARMANAPTPQHAAALGALTGPVWAIAMVILNAVATKTEQIPIWGAADGASVFGFTLLVGGVLGAVGGLLAVQRQPGVASPAAAPPVA